ncbi:B3 domain-containing transcription factor VRN1 isoform X1 [Quercus suber]|uniref:B3 domain-containing transcription factor VRN1 isoform X1 n=1 Tax=Quercus suber TaxID=58331 RepID=UPI0032DE3F6D
MPWRNNVSDERVDQQKLYKSCIRTALKNLMHRPDGDNIHLAKDADTLKAKVQSTREIGIQFNESELTRTAGEVGSGYWDEARQSAKRRKQSTEATEFNVEVGMPGAKVSIAVAEKRGRAIRAALRPRTRCRGVEPTDKCERRCKYPTRDPETFFKIVFNEKILRLPEIFLQKFGDQLASIATVNSPNGRVWQLSLGKDENGTWFSDGWDKFLDYHSISSNGHIIIFKYEGNSTFNVLFMFDMTAGKIDYPIDNLSSDAEPDSVPNEEEEKHFGYNDVSVSTTYNPSQNSSESWTSDEYFSQGVLKKRNKYTTWTDRKKRHIRKGACSSGQATTQSCDKCGHHKESEFAKFDNEESEKTPKEGRFYSSGKRNPKSKYKVDDFSATSGFSKFSKTIQAAKKRARKAADMFQSEHPFFKAILRRHNIYNSFVYVPAGFAMKYLPSESIALQDSNGKRFPARCFDREGSGAGRSIGKGWATFAREHDLEEGDVLVFELINREAIVLEVHIFRAIDYSGM